MNVVGIGITKGKSTIAVMRPFGKVVASPYEVGHTESELKELAKFLKSLPGETHVLMEYTGHYNEPIVRYLHEACFDLILSSMSYLYNRFCRTADLLRRSAEFHN